MCTAATWTGRLSRVLPPRSAPSAHPLVCYTAFSHQITFLYCEASCPCSWRHEGSARGCPGGWRAAGATGAAGSAAVGVRPACGALVPGDARRGPGRRAARQGRPLPAAGSSGRRCSRGRPRNPRAGSWTTWSAPAPARSMPLLEGGRRGCAAPRLSRSKGRRRRAGCRGSRAGLHGARCEHPPALHRRPLRGRPGGRAGARRLQQGGAGAAEQQEADPALHQPLGAGGAAAARGLPGLPRGQEAGRRRRPPAPRARPGAVCCRRAAARRRCRPRPLAAPRARRTSAP